MRFTQRSSSQCASFEITHNITNITDISNNHLKMLIEIDVFCSSLMDFCDFGDDLEVVGNVFAKGQRHLVCARLEFWEGS